MKKTILVTALSAIILPITSMAATTQGTANFTLVAPVAVAVNTTMDFGNVEKTVGTCTLGDDGVKSGTICDTWADGAAAVFDLTANADVSVSFSNVQAGTGLTFTPLIGGAATGTVLNGNATFSHGGTLEITDAATASGTSLTYDVNVTY